MNTKLAEFWINPAGINQGYEKKLGLHLMPKTG